VRGPKNEHESGLSLTTVGGPCRGLGLFPHYSQKLTQVQRVGRNKRSALRHSWLTELTGRLQFARPVPRKYSAVTYSSHMRLKETVAQR
jgi:hypothetical protein